MKATTFAGRNKIRYGEVPDPEILNGGDAIIRVTTAAICGSDLHLVDGYVPTMVDGDVIGHEFMGEVVDTGPNVTKIKTGDRIRVNGSTGVVEILPDGYEAREAPASDLLTT